MAKPRGQGSIVASAATPEYIEQQKIKAAVKGLSDFSALTESQQLELLQERFGDRFTSKKSFQWTLKSGETRTFYEINVPYEDLEAKTTVTFEINGREQSLLTTVTLSDLDSMEIQQHYPAIGYYNEEGKIDYADGSRRRKRVILSNGKIPFLKSWVTDEPISLSDARALAKDLQTAKEHNLWEIGQMAKTYQQKQPGITQDAIAKLLGYSRTKINRALKAVMVDGRIIALFTDVSELSHADYDVLIKAQEKAIDRNELDDEIEILKIDIAEHYKNPEFDSPYNLIIKTFKAYLLAKKSKKAVVKFNDIEKFDDKNTFAKVKKEKQKVTYTFSRLSAEFTNKLEQFIKQELKDEIERNDKSK